MPVTRLFLPSLIAVAISTCDAQAVCLPERIPQVLAERPHSPTAAAELIASCQQTETLDFRTLMQLGAIAREQGDLAAAANFFEKAHALNPHAESALLELALTREWERNPQAARHLYGQVLERDPGLRAALLGLGRVERAQYRLDEARSIYQHLLQADPHDLEALNGMAWVALANRRLVEARRGFEGVLAVAPDNAEAKDGIRGIDNTWPYQLDLAGGVVRTQVGRAWSGSAVLRADLDATRSIEVGAYHYTSELPTVQLTEQTPLPSNDLHLGYYVRVPDGYNWALIYDYRSHSALPTEQWIEARVGSYFADRLQWFASVRQSFGAPEWDNRLFQTGLVLPLANRWEIAPTVYYQEVEGHRAATAFPNQRSLYAYGVDLTRQGPGNSFFNVGVGYSPDISNVDLHTRWVWPIGPQGSLLVTLEHVSVNHELQASIGWRFYWR